MSARSTVARWAAGQSLPPRNKHPWTPDEIPVDDYLGKIFRRVYVPFVRPQFWQTQAMRERRDALLASWPREQGWLDDGEPGWRCYEPIRLPGRLRELLEQGSGERTRDDLSDKELEAPLDSPAVGAPTVSPPPPTTMTPRARPRERFWSLRSGHSAALLSRGEAHKPMTTQAMDRALRLIAKDLSA